MLLFVWEAIKLGQSQVIGDLAIPQIYFINVSTSKHASVWMPPIITQLGIVLQVTKASYAQTVKLAIAEQLSQEVDFNAKNAQTR